jgi:helicase
MAGRAGRPGLDPYGEAVLMGSSEMEAGHLFSNYIDSAPEDVNSQCASENALTTHILSLIASGFIASRKDLLSFMRDTFFFHQKKDDRLLDRITGHAINFLDQEEMIVASGDFLSPTEYGSLVSQLYIDPLGAGIIVERLIGSACYSDIGLLQVICSTPDMFTLFVNSKDRYYLERFLLEHERELWLDLPLREDEVYFRSLKTAMVLHDWSHELPDATICERYGISPGDIFALNETIRWLLHATGRLARMFRKPYVSPIQELELCLKHGVKRELIPLVRIRNIGRVRARRLFNNGFTSPEKILSAGEDRIIPVLGHGITEQVFRYLHEQSSGAGVSRESQHRRSGLFRFVDEVDDETDR